MANPCTSTMTDVPHATEESDVRVLRQATRPVSRPYQPCSQDRCASVLQPPLHGPGASHTQAEGAEGRGEAALRYRVPAQESRAAEGKEESLFRAHVRSREGCHGP